MMYSEIHQALKDINARKNAAITLQATWRGILARRKTKKMLKGFMELQKLYRERLQVDHFLRFILISGFQNIKWYSDLSCKTWSFFRTKSQICLQCWTNLKKSLKLSLNCCAVVVWKKSRCMQASKIPHLEICCPDFSPPKKKERQPKYRLVDFAFQNHWHCLVILFNNIVW